MKYSHQTLFKYCNNNSKYGIRWLKIRFTSPLKESTLFCIKHKETIQTDKEYKDRLWLQGNNIVYYMNVLKRHASKTPLDRIKWEMILLLYVMVLLCFSLAGCIIITGSIPVQLCRRLAVKLWALFVLQTPKSKCFLPLTLDVAYSFVSHWLLFFPPLLVD